MFSVIVFRFDSIFPLVQAIRNDQLTLHRLNERIKELQQAEERANIFAFFRGAVFMQFCSRLIGF